MLKRKRIDTDLCVIGGGMAGICTAIAAAREGIKVILMHERPVLGGNASSEIRMWVCGAQGDNNRETGIIEEIALENYYRNPTKNYFIWDTILYDFVIREKNITLLLNCTCMDAKVKNGEYEDGRNTKIETVTGYQMTTQTFYDIKAKIFSDCSGDSILAPLTGAEFRIGRECADEFGEDTHVKVHDNYTMGNSCLIQGRETTAPVKFTPPPFSTKLTKEHFQDRNPDIYKPSENFWYLELGGDRDTIHQADEIMHELIPLATGTWYYIKNSGEFNSQNWELDFLGFLPGKRESRRMVGEYIITERDVTENRQFDDTVAFGGWPLDDHFPDGFYHKGQPNTNIHTPAPYCIPYRALYSKNVENLYFAGRNISMTHMAMSSIRVMATCAVMGQAVGTAAALAVKLNLTPNGIYKSKINELQQILMENDCLIPNKSRKISNICKNAELTNGNDLLRDAIDRVNHIYSNEKCGITVLNNTEITYKFKKEEFINTVHITFNSDLNRETLPGNYCEKYHTMRANTLLDSPQFYVPKTLCKKFILQAVKNGSRITISQIDNNLNRSYNIKISDHIEGLILIPVENWGNTDKTDIFSFDFN